MKQFYLYLLMVIGIVFLNGCSKDDDNPVKTETELVLPKEVYRMQIVGAKFSEPLPQEEYDGMLGNTPIKFVRTDEKTLLFYITGEVALGETTLTISQLNVSNKLNVKNPELKGSAETVLQPLFEKTTPEHQGITNTKDIDKLTTVNTAFKDYYQTLSFEEKNNMALFYKVNETFFTDILNPHYQEAKGINEAVSANTKFGIAAGLFLASSTAFIFVNVTPGEKVILGALAWVSWLKTKRYIDELTNGGVNVITLFTDKLAPKGLESANLNFVNNKTKNLVLYAKQRNIISEDRSSTATGLMKFFNTEEKVTTTTSKVNNIIKSINSNVFFANIPLIPFFEIPTTAESKTVPLTAETFSYMKFNVTDPNVQITEAKFENGTIRMKMIVINPNAVTGKSINTELNYTYQEAFNNIAGSIDIKVLLEDMPELTGVWMLQWYESDSGHHNQDDWINFKNGASDKAFNQMSVNYGSSDGSSPGWSHSYTDTSDIYLQWVQSTSYDLSSSRYIISIQNVGRPNVVISFYYDPNKNSYEGLDFGSYFTNKLVKQ